MVYSDDYADFRYERADVAVRLSAPMPRSLGGIAFWVIRVISVTFINEFRLIFCMFVENSIGESGEIRLVAKDGRVVNLGSHRYVARMPDTLFESGNGRKELLDLPDKVFDCLYYGIKKYNTVRYKEMHSGVVDENSQALDRHITCLEDSVVSMLEKLAAAELFSSPVNKKYD